MTILYMLYINRRNLSNLNRFLVSIGQHGKATRHANYLYLHFIPHNDYTGCENKE